VEPRCDWFTTKLDPAGLPGLPVSAQNVVRQRTGPSVLAGAGSLELTGGHGKGASWQLAVVKCGEQQEAPSSMTWSGPAGAVRRSGPVGVRDPSVRTEGVTLPMADGRMPTGMRTAEDPGSTVAAAGGDGGSPPRGLVLGSFPSAGSTAVTGVAPSRRATTSPVGRHAATVPISARGSLKTFPPGSLHSAGEIP
jgi:hypothetical protein